MVVIPKSVNPKRIAENYKATQIQLDDGDVQKIKALDKPGGRVFKVKFTQWYSAAACTLDLCTYGM